MSNNQKVYPVWVGDGVGDYYGGPSVQSIDLLSQPAAAAATKAAAAAPPAPPRSQQVYPNMRSLLMRDFTINQRDVFTIILFNLFSCRLVSARSGWSQVSGLWSLVSGPCLVWALFSFALSLSLSLAPSLCVSIVINCVRDSCSVCVCWCVCGCVCVWLLVGQLERSAGFYVVVGGVGNNETVFRYEHRECVAKYAKRLSPHRHRHRWIAMAGLLASWWLC